MSWRRLIYSVSWYLLLPVVLARLLLKSRANKAYQQRWGERFGWAKPFPERSRREAGRTRQNIDGTLNQSENPQFICLHAVSVGEVMAARPLVEALLRDMPEYCLWITTTTPTGSDTVQRLFTDELAAGNIKHSYLPYDLPEAVARFLTSVRPTLMLVVETELWPNLYAACAQRAIPLLLVNARLSERSVRRYQKIGGLVAETLGCVSAIMARSEQDAVRFRQLGADPAQLEVAGNIKFDIAPDPAVAEQGAAIRQQLGQRPVWCAGSTHQGEEEILLAVQSRLLVQFPDLLLILVPRHPERFAAVAGLCAASGLPWVRRSEQALVDSEHTIHQCNVLLGDSMGELLLWYAASDLAFVGGSLVAVGGHNPLEALTFGVPVLSGQHVNNFPDLYPLLQVIQSAKLVASADELYAAVQYWLQCSDERRDCGQAGQRFLRENRGVVERLMQAINDNRNRSL